MHISLIKVQGEGSHNATDSRYKAPEDHVKALHGVRTGCEAGLPSAIGPPPPPRLGTIACDAITLRDKPASEAGRNAISAALYLIPVPRSNFFQ